MLPAEHRMRRSEDFRRAVRRGRRSGGRLLVVHLLTPADADPATAPSLVGLVVGRGVGGSVVRSAVSRRLRHLLRARIDRLSAGSLLVVRALPGSGPASSAALAVELDRALDRLLPAPAAA